MRIFYASDTTPNSFLKSNIWENNLYLPLIDLKHDVVKFQYDLRKTFQHLNPIDPIQKKFILKNRPKVSQALLKQVKAAHNKKPIDLFFSYLLDACILPETIDEIKSLGIKTVNWYCNASYQLNLVSQISPIYDYCLVPEKFRMDDYRALGANPIYCQEAANPSIYKPYNVPQTYDVTFIGQAYGERPDYIKYLLDNNIAIHVWGLGWNNFEPNQQHLFKKILDKGKKIFSPELFKALQYKMHYLFHPQDKKKVLQNAAFTSNAILPSHIIGGTLSDHEMIQMYSKSKINLGLSACGNTHKENTIKQIRLRDFEIPMSGGFYMTEYMEELEAFFDIDKEIVCYHNKQDLADKIKYYLKHETIRNKISMAGQKRCLRDHTWHKRFQSVFEKIFQRKDFLAPPEKPPQPLTISPHLLKPTK